MSCLCVIPARGGSKRIPRKNIKEFLGKPIIVYSIEAALQSALFEEVMVSTDSDEISSISKKFGAKVPFMRSNDNANDFAGIAEVLIEVLNQYEKMNIFYDIVCCILPTAPFVTSEKLKNAYDIMIGGGFNCVLPVLEYSYPIQRSLFVDNGFVRMRWPENLNKRSQDLEKTYHDSGQFYFIYSDTLKREKKLFTQKSGSIILNDLEAQDIDTETDWKLAELKYSLLKKIQ